MQHLTQPKRSTTTYAKVLQLAADSDLRMVSKSWRRTTAGNGISDAYRAVDFLAEVTPSASVGPWVAYLPATGSLPDREVQGCPTIDAAQTAAQILYEMAR